MKKSLIISLFFVALISAGCSKKDSSFGGPFDSNLIESFSRSSSTLVNVGAMEIMATNTARTYAYIVNDSDTAVYLNFSNAATTKKLYSVRLNATGGSYEINSENLYIGPIYASTTVAGKKLRYLEK